MENVIFADTHVVVWLYAGKTELFSESVLGKLTSNEIYISPAVRFELQYLYEVGKIKEKPEKIIQTLSKEIGLKESNDGFIEIINEAIKHNWTRDPFDRIITAQASLHNFGLITKDSSILSNYKLAFWE